MKQHPLRLKKVKVHNLKEIDLILRPKELIVFTGVSGSGKSSLAFDTIYVEGQRRYIESLSNHARRHMGNFPKPDAEAIEGISPTIAIEQKKGAYNPRSTVGTMTAIYDYLRVLFARVGTPYCPISQEKVKPQSLQHIISTVFSFKKGSKLIILAPYVSQKKGEFKELFEDLIRKGFLRVRLDGHLVDLSEPINLDKSVSHTLDLVVDRLVLNEANKNRLIESLTYALELGKGVLSVLDPLTNVETLFSKHAYAQKSKQSYLPLEPHDFSFNHPLGMCENCEGLGKIQDFDLDLVIDPKLSIAENCCSIAGDFKTLKWGNIYRNLSSMYRFDLNTPWEKLSTRAKNIFLYGNKKKWTPMRFVHPKKNLEWTEYIHWKGVIFEAKKNLSAAKSSFYRAKKEKLMQEMTCPFCSGSRLKPYPSHVKLGDQTLHQITAMAIDECLEFFSKLTLPPFEKRIARELLSEIQKRLTCLTQMGLSYLCLNRSVPTLSGGEVQRLRLTSQIGSALVGSTYILDEPSVGLHARDHIKLIKMLKALRDLGNRVIVVEHDEEMIKAANHIVDIGPKAGIHGGKIVAQGNVMDLIQTKESLTGAYLSGKYSIPIPQKRRKIGKKKLTILKASQNNLKEISLSIPLECFVTITGVSGSGKSSLVQEIIYPFLSNHLQRSDKKVGKHKKIEGTEHLDKVIAIDQSPIGRTPRSNPSTYIKLFDLIRSHYAKLPQSVSRGYKSGRFSFNVAEGSCPKCLGMGAICIDMDFMEDVWKECPLCKGKRFDQATLEICYKGKSIHDVLEMSVEKALAFFEAIPSIFEKLSLLSRVGLGYLTLGQSSTTLSGGEAQRIKLAKELVRPASGQTLYILDEPTTGLHFHDISKLISILDELVAGGNSILMIEHHMDLIKRSDYVIDLGPEGGDAGGNVIGEGPPEMIAQLNSPTGKALRALFKKKKEQKLLSNKDSLPQVDTIEIKNAYQNNLKNISLSIPREKITIFTGPSGSGKSSLAFETLYAEGQRRYVESLPSYARQFIKQMPRPKVEQIDGLSPSIAIEQKHHAGNPRSTVGTMTEIYDFLRLIYAHLGVAHCIETGEKVESITKEYVINALMKLPSKTAIYLLAPLPNPLHEPFEEIQKKLLQKGFLRIRLNGTYYALDEPILYEKTKKNICFLVIDRMKIHPGIENRLFEAIEQIEKITPHPFVVATSKQDFLFNLSFAAPRSGKSYPPLTPHTFSFNAEEGMCPECLGLGFQWGINLLKHQKIMRLSTYALMKHLMKEEMTEKAKALLFLFFKKENIDPKTPLYQLPIDTLHVLLNGKKAKDSFSFQGLTLEWEGIHNTLLKGVKGGTNRLKSSLIPLLEESLCISCKGERLNRFARHVEIKGITLGTLTALPLKETFAFISSLDSKKNQFLKDVFKQIKDRLHFLIDMGLHYLSLHRKASTLSGGETERIQLARQLGTTFSGCLYVLDEPTMGLHPKNSSQLHKALKKLSSLGNTLVLVEHDPMTLKIADHIVDFGPRAGNQGGEVMAQGTYEEIKKNKFSTTGQYLSQKKTIPLPQKRRSSSSFIEIKNAKKHNLKNLNVRIPTGVLTCISGVSGSGKSTLIHYLLKKGLQLHLAKRSKNPSITIDEATIERIDQFDKLIVIDQNPLGHTIRSDVCTYSDLLTPIRQFYSELPEAKIKGLKPKHFSYNHLQGMCRSCFGLGFKTISLQFLPSLKVTCESCFGYRLNPLSNQIAYKGKKLGDLLKLTIDQIATFLPPIFKLQKKLQSLKNVGLNYLSLGQPTSSLSGGEASRLRLSRELAKRATGKTLYLFDEPTMGLHLEDIHQLIPLFQALVNQGNTLIIIEHHLDILKIADHIIDLGPEAGEKGGEVIAQGSPEEIMQSPFSSTGHYLHNLLHMIG